MGRAFQHSSDCALHNGPALPAGPCDCGAGDEHDEWARREWDAIWSNARGGQGRREAGRRTRALIASLRRQADLQKMVEELVAADRDGYPLSGGDVIHMLIRHGIIEADEAVRLIGPAVPSRSSGGEDEIPF